MKILDNYRVIHIILHMYSSINNYKEKCKEKDIFLNKVSRDSTYFDFKRSFNDIIKKLFLYITKKSDNVDIFTIETYIYNYIDSKFNEKINQSQNITNKVDSTDIELISCKNGVLDDIIKSQMRDIGNRAEAITYYSKIKSAQKEMECLINDFITYAKHAYNKELINCSTQADKISKIELTVLSEKNIKDKIDNIANSLYYYIAHIDKEVEVIRNLNKTTELKLK